MPWTEIEISFTDELQKEEFDKKLNILKSRWKTNSNLEFMQKLLNVALTRDEFAECETDRVLRQIKSANYNPYHNVKPETANTVELFVTCVPSIMHLVKQVHAIGKEGLGCPEYDTFDRKMHVGIVSFTMDKSKDSSFKWKSSPYIDTAFLVNYKMSFGFLTSGLPYEQFQKFSTAAGIGNMSESFLEKETKKLQPHVQALSDQSVRAALQEANDKALNQGKTGGISIETGAFHCATKTNVFALDNIGHKIVASTVVSCSDNPISQSHEKIGTERLDTYFTSYYTEIVAVVNDQCKPGNNVIKNKCTNSMRGHYKNKTQSRVWITTKSECESFHKISKGAAKNDGHTWSSQLANQKESLTECIYIIWRNSGNDPELFKEGLLSVPQHYQNIHDSCPLESPCQKPGFVPNFTILSDSVAVSLLTKWLTSLNIYKQAEKFTQAKDEETFYIKSANKSLRQYIPQKLNYGDKSYAIRTGIFILDWNESLQKNAESKSEERDRRKKKKPQNRREFLNKLWVMMWEHNCSFAVY